MPKPSRRNPFKAGGQPARQFDHMLKLYAEGRRDILRLGPARCMGNNMAVAFWRGYDSIPRTPLPTSPARCPARNAPLDNAACEDFFGRLKNELFYPRNWKGVTIAQFIEMVDDYIRWYNEKRIKISLGSLSPIEYRVSLGLAA